MSPSSKMGEMDAPEPQKSGFPPLMIGRREWPQAELAEAIVRERLTPAENALVREYFWIIGFKAVKKLLRTDEMAQACLANGRPVMFLHDDRRLLTESRDLRDELTVEVLLYTVPIFFAQLEHWRPERGASLTTYFVGACIRMFKTAYSSWAKTRERKWIHSSRLAEAPFGPSYTFTDQVAIEETIRQVFALAKPNQRPVLALLYSGYSQVEAAKELGLSTRAIEGRMYQLRKRVVQATKDGLISPPAGFAPVPVPSQATGPVMI
ncbi:DNA-directed RNA polymerase specialized sigma subunit, sigma24 family [Arthrobacter sp. OV608]|nr:DNA-directed RNA polymerase specialized sigma subunit, sigma24 family [Arthrobacter sp. OV608]